MKPFKSSEFISNEETPVVTRNGKPVEIITVKGRGDQKVLGYIDKGEEIKHWWHGGEIGLSGKKSQWDLFFAPNVEVVHVFEHKESGEIDTTLKYERAKHWATYRSYAYIGTITGPIVPPEKSEVVK